MSSRAAKSARLFSARSSGVASWSQRHALPAFLIAACAFAAEATAAYPERPIRYVVPAAAGGAPDIMSRTFAAELSRQMAQQIVVDNRPGASGSIGTVVVARAAPDGYTMGAGNVLTLALNRSVLPKLPYDPDRDLQPVVRTTAVPNLLAVTLSLPVNSVQELIDYGKRNPDKLSFASAGSGSSVHVSAELFKLLTGTQMVHVPFKAAVLAIADVTAGRVHLMFDNIPSIGPHVQAGRLRGLAVTSAKRVPAYADLPTVAEAGVPGFEVTAWGGIVVPGGTPRRIVARLNGEFNRVFSMPHIRERIASFGSELVGGTPGELAEHVRKETAKWADVVKRAGVKVD